MSVHIERVVMERVDAAAPPAAGALAVALKRALEKELAASPDVRRGVERAVRAAFEPWSRLL